MDPAAQPPGFARHAELIAELSRQLRLKPGQLTQVRLREALAILQGGIGALGREQWQELSRNPDVAARVAAWLGGRVRLIATAQTHQENSSKASARSTESRIRLFERLQGAIAAGTDRSNHELRQILSTLSKADSRADDAQHLRTEPRQAVALVSPELADLIDRYSAVEHYGYRPEQLTSFVETAESPSEPAPVVQQEFSADVDDVQAFDGSLRPAVALEWVWSAWQNGALSATDLDGLDSFRSECLRRLLESGSRRYIAAISRTVNRHRDAVAVAVLRGALELAEKVPPQLRVVQRAPGKVNVLEVAATAGVSKAAVERAFSHATSITEENRQRILQVAERLGYEPPKRRQSDIAVADQGVGIPTDVPAAGRVATADLPDLGAETTTFVFPKEFREGPLFNCAPPMVTFINEFQAEIKAVIGPGLDDSRDAREQGVLEEAIARGVGFEWKNDGFGFGAAGLRTAWDLVRNSKNRLAVAGVMEFGDEGAHAFGMKKRADGKVEVFEMVGGKEQRWVGDEQVRQWFDSRAEMKPGRILGIVVGERVEGQPFVEGRDRKAIIARSAPHGRVRGLRFGRRDSGQAGAVAGFLSRIRGQVATIWQQRKLLSQWPAAVALSRAGFRVEGGEELRLDGEVFEPITPREVGVNGLGSWVEQVMEEARARRVVLDLNDVTVEIPDLVRLLGDRPIVGLHEVVAIDRFGTVVQLGPEDLAPAQDGTTQRPEPTDNNDDGPDSGGSGVGDGDGPPLPEPEPEQPSDGLLPQPLVVLRRDDVQRLERLQAELLTSRPRRR